MSDPSPTPPVVTAKDEEQASAFVRSNNVFADGCKDGFGAYVPDVTVSRFRELLASALAAARAEGAAQNFAAGKVEGYREADIEWRERLLSARAAGYDQGRAEGAAAEREKAARIAETWQSSTFPYGEPVDHATHEQICADICKTLAEEIRRS